MFIEEMQILVDCKRLVEHMLEEKKALLISCDGTVSNSTIMYIQKKIARLEAALQVKGVN